MSIQIHSQTGRLTANRCALFRKMPDAYRRMFLNLAGGHEAFEVDFDNGIVLAMKCATTSAGQSSARRDLTEQITALWAEVKSAHAPNWETVPIGNYKGVLRNSDPVLPDLSKPDAVSTWLTS